MGLIAAIVILVILAGLASFVVSLTTTQNMTLALDFQSARAYQAVRAGSEWALAQWFNANTCSATGAPASIPGIDGVTLAYTLTPDPPPPVPPSRVAFCTIEVTARSGTVERNLRIVAESG